MTFIFPVSYSGMGISVAEEFSRSSLKITSNISKLLTDLPIFRQQGRRACEGMYGIGAAG